MKIKEKLLLDRDGLYENGPINICVFGDSITHGFFNGYIDYESVYWNKLRKKLLAVNDYIPINVINAGIGGTTAKKSLPRLYRDVIKHEPDLVIVSFGLNDVNGSLEDYLDSMRTIFDECLKAGLDVIFMTPNMMNTYVAEDTQKGFFFHYAKKTAEMQNSGRVDEFINSAATLAENMGIKVCDVYKKWKELSRTEDVTKLLSNRINHPTPEMHQLFADSLYEIIME